MIEAPASKSFAVSRDRRATDLPLLRASPLTWLNLVCLDAPLVAIAWQWLFARSLLIPVEVGATAALFLTAWLIYLADRLGDATSLKPDASTSLRQRFCLRHRSRWRLLVAIVGVADLVLIATRLDATRLIIGSVVGIAACAYLLVNRKWETLWQTVPAKEISIGFLFAAGALVPLAPRLTGAIWPTWLLFAVLCALNCICIAVWERFLDLAQQRTSIATAFPGAGWLIIPALLGVFAASLWLAVSNSRTAEVHFCLAASAALLAFIHLVRRRVPQDVRTALADLVLLTPLAFLLVR